MKKKKRRVKKNESDEPKLDLRVKITELLELPKEVALDMPKITMIGNGSLVIENYKGIIEYESNRIRINTGSGVIRLTGVRLVIKEITSENIMVNGDIGSLEFLK